MQMKNNTWLFYTLLLSSFILLFSACDDNDTIPEDKTTGGNLKGTGSFVYTDFDPLANKPTKVFYHIPSSSNQNTPIVFVFHGANRDAQESRDALIANADQNNIIIVVPEFSEINFPGGDGYNLGNVFVDGDNPSPQTLNEEDQWAFSLVEPLFDYVKLLSSNTSANYSVFGFSAGGQFAHRFLFFKPNARINKAVASSSGWYTMPDNQVDFPYGLKESPVLNSSLASIFSKQLTVLIGELDDDPNASSLRRNSQADLQGTNRLARAQYFYNESITIANTKGLIYNWQYVSLPNVSHDINATANYAFDNIFTN